MREVWGLRGLAGFGGTPLSRGNTWKAALSVPLPGLWQCKRACAAKVCVAVEERIRSGRFVAGGARERRKGECPLAFCATIVAKRSPPSLSLSRPPAPVAPDIPKLGNKQPQNSPAACLARMTDFTVLRANRQELESRLPAVLENRNR